MLKRSAPDWRQCLTRISFPPFPMAAELPPLKRQILSFNGVKLCKITLFSGTFFLKWSKSIQSALPYGTLRSEPAKHLTGCGIKHKKTARFAGGLAEKPGFEPGRRLSHPTPLAGEPLRPLGYFSMVGSCGGKNWRRERDSNPRCLSTSPVFKTGALNLSAISPYGQRPPKHILIIPTLCPVVNP